MPIGPIELIVRDVDDKGQITGVGLSFEPTAPVARVPVFLSAGEIADRLIAFLRDRRRKRGQPQAAQAKEEGRPKAVAEAGQPASQETASEEDMGDDAPQAA